MVFLQLYYIKTLHILDKKVMLINPEAPQKTMVIYL